MKTVSLRDGSQVTLRPLRPDDESALTALYERLSPQASYQRFFTVMRRLPPDWAHILATVDYDRKMAIVALGPENELIGVARYVYEARTQEAEIAAVVEDRWQGRGLGTQLVTELIRYAGDKGILRFRAHVLADNLRMLKLIERVATIRDRTLESGVVSFLLAPRDHREPAGTPLVANSGREPSAPASPAASTARGGGAASDR